MFDGVDQHLVSLLPTCQANSESELVGHVCQTRSIRLLIVVYFGICFDNFGQRKNRLVNHRQRLKGRRV